MVRSIINYGSKDVPVDRVETCVVYSDIVEWTKRDLSTQIDLVVALFYNISQKLKDRNLTPLWKTSTGDGFALLFDRRHDVLVVDACAHLHDQYISNGTPIRLAVACGPIFYFHSPLTGRPDVAGPALITGRRILEGITGGNITLVDDAFARDVTGRLSPHLSRRFIDHPEVIDKHRVRHSVKQLISDTDHPRSEPLVPSLPKNLRQLASTTRSPKISPDLWQECCVDGLVIQWMTSSARGLEAVAVGVKDADVEGTDPGTGLPADFTHWIIPHRDEVRKEIGDDNRKKVWLSSYRTPLSDRISFDLEVGRTDYLTARSLQKAFDASNGIRAEYERGDRNIHLSLPGMIVPHSVILTSDNHVILAHRKPRQVDFAAGSWSVSFEEQWDPDKDKAPHETVLRGLKEEFNISSDRGVPISMDNLWLMALAREWGEFWNSEMIYLVRAPVGAEKVLDCWSDIPPPEDKDEHVAVAAVPLSTDTGRNFMVSLLERSAEITSATLLDVCGQANIRGYLNPGAYPVHPTSGRARILIALWAAGCIK